MRTARTAGLVLTTLTALALSAVGTAALANGIDPATTKLPWKNGTDGNAQYFFGEHRGTVHVLEAYSLGCSWCNKNAPQVQAMATEFGDDLQVQFLDLGLDTRDTDYVRWIQTHHPMYPVVKDTGRAVFNALKSEDGIPQTFVLNCKGELVENTVGYWGDGEKAAIRAAIAKAKETTCD
jgi:hypothetical protein